MLRVPAEKHCPRLKAPLQSPSLPRAGSCISHVGLQGTPQPALAAGTQPAPGSRVLRVPQKDPNPLEGGPGPEMVQCWVSRTTSVCDLSPQPTGSHALSGIGSHHGGGKKLRTQSTSCASLVLPSPPLSSLLLYLLQLSHHVQSLAHPRNHNDHGVEQQWCREHYGNEHPPGVEVLVFGK